MVAPSKGQAKVALGLQVLCADIGDLADLDAEWATLSDGERASWSLDWDHVMCTYLPLIDEAYRQGRMTPDQAESYRALLARLKAATPILERLDLSRPTVSLELR